MGPEITVLLPTYNRSEYIRLALKSVLNQDFKKYEVLVLDDYDKKDTTEDVVQSFVDRRIIYKKNRRNLGYALNLKNGFRQAKGKYIFILSDDDIILNTNTFSTIVKEMDKMKAGYGQTGLMYYDLSHTKPSVLDHVDSKLIYIKPSKDVILKTLDWHYGFMSGNVFRKDFVDIEHDLHDTDIWWPYLRAAYRAMTEHGGIYFGKNFIIARTSTTGLISFVDVEKNKGFYMDLLFDIYREFDPSPERFKVFLKNRLDVVVNTFPGIKYYTSNRNIKEMAKAVIKHRPEYVFEVSFWYRFLSAYLLPKFILSILRTIRAMIGYAKMRPIIREVQVEENLKKALK